MTLREKRVAFTRAFSALLTWAFTLTPGIGIAYGEGLVKHTDAADGDYDGPHKRGGGHYTGLAHDIELYVDGEYVTNGDHPIYKLLGEWWEALHPLARWGGRFGDANHFSFEHEGVK